MNFDNRVYALLTICFRRFYSFFTIIEKQNQEQLDKDFFSSEEPSFFQSVINGPARIDNLKRK